MICDASCLPMGCVCGVLNPDLGRHDPVLGLGSTQISVVNPMPTFPIPIFAAVTLVLTATHLWHRNGRLNLLIGLLILCAVQSLIIALSQHYGVWGTRQVQPVTAAMIAPMAWIAFQGRFVRSDLLHLLAPLAALAALLVAPPFLDVLLPGVFAVYGGMIVYHAKQGGDSQPDALLSSGDIPSHLWVGIGIGLIASAFSDVLIVVAQSAGHLGWRPWIISIFSAGNFLLIGALSLSPHLQTAAADEPEDAAPAPREPDAEVWEKVEAYMTERKPYLDPDLTLSRLSRKIGIPAKTLSSTINVATGGNVSRFINQARIKTAQDAMRDGENVTNAMLSSGFNTKSNFNREFLRIVGQSPSAWLSEAQYVNQ